MLILGFIGLLLVLTVLLLNSFRKIIFCKNKKNIVTNINRVQACNSIMSRFFCIGFIDYMLAFRTFIGCTYLISPHNFKKNDKIILKYIKMGEPSDIYISKFK